MEQQKVVTAFGHEFGVLREVVMKGRDGWEAKTYIDLGLDGAGKRRVLVVDTGKPVSRADEGIGAVSTASVHESNDGFLSIAIFQDFHQTVNRGAAGKCTEKAVRLVHEQTMAAIAMVIARVVEFYRDKGQTVGWKMDVAEAA